VIQEGLLWFDDDPVRAVSDKIARAVQRYEQKYGRRPDVCYVHPSHLGKSDAQPSDGVRVVPAKSVLPYHFWVGIEAKKERRSSSVARSAE